MKNFFVDLGFNSELSLHSPIQKLCAKVTKFLLMQKTEFSQKENWKISHLEFSILAADLGRVLADTCSGME